MELNERIKSFWEGEARVYSDSIQDELKGPQKSAWLKLLERAKVIGFRWHDMRHDFASRLVMAGIPLNTVRDLLGHKDIKMTLRYAHLAPGTKAAAVEMI